MTTEEALSEVEDAASRAPTGDLHEAWRVLKAALADATARAERAEKALIDCDDTAIYGVCDCIDNDGVPYQSQWLADILARAKAANLDAPATGEGE